MIVLTYLYALITKMRNYLYNKNILKIKRVEGVEVICIGNITVGGTGKTPAVQYFAKKYKESGKKVAVVSRGYGGKRAIDPLIVSDGINIKAVVEESGDESYLHALKLEGIPVVVGKDRYRAVIMAKETFDIDTVILDDGFQHRKLHRDKNIVLIDATKPFGGGELLPKGRLREELSELKRADEFIITKCNMVGKKEVVEIKRGLKKYNKKILCEEHTVNSFYDLSGEEADNTILKGKKIMLVSGLANPEQFEKSVAKFKPREVVSKTYKDHHSYSNEDIEDIKELAIKEEVDYILITEKDMVKFPKDLESKLFYVLGIEFKLNL